MPIAHAGPDLQLLQSGASTSAVLDGSASRDEGGRPLGFRWTRLSGPSNVTLTTPTAAQTVVAGLQPGTHLFELRVTNDRGAFASDTATVTVQPLPNDAPVADAGADQQVARPTASPASTVLDGSGSFDPDGTLAAFAWRLTAGPAPAVIVTPGSAQTAVTGLLNGVYSFELRVTDARGASAVDTVAVTVFEAAPPAGGPTARAGRDRVLLLPAASTVLDGSASSSPGGGPLRFFWEQIGGPAAGCASGHDTARLALSRLARGRYRLRLTVTDAQGRSDTDEVGVTLTHPLVAK